MHLSTLGSNPVLIRILDVVAQKDWNFNTRDIINRIHFVLRGTEDFCSPTNSGKCKGLKVGSILMVPEAIMPSAQRGAFPQNTDSLFFPQTFLLRESNLAQFFPWHADSISFISKHQIPLCCTRINLS